MAIKKLFSLLGFAAFFCLTFSASVLVAQIAVEEKAAPPDSLFPKSIIGTWRLNDIESDDVIAKMADMLQRKNNVMNDEMDEAKQAEMPALSISLFPADMLMLVTDSDADITINEFFRDVIKTRMVLTDGNRREFSLARGAKFSVTATRTNDKLSVETISPRGNIVIETFALSEGGSKLIVILVIEDSGLQQLLTLRRVYDRALVNISVEDEIEEIY